MIFALHTRTSAARRWCCRDTWLTAWRAGIMLTAVTGIADHVPRTARCGTDGRRNTRAGLVLGRRLSRSGHRDIAEAQAGGCPLTWRAGTASSWAAAPGTCRRGWPAAARGRWAWITPRRSWPPPASCRTVSAAVPADPLHASAEQAPFTDASFDVAISEYGASIWCDPFTVDSRGGPAAAPRRSADLPGELRAAHAHRPRHR